ncbi:MAG: hypothetical protein WDM91_15365 [Rhizomicrobium sp.]
MDALVDFAHKCVRDLVDHLKDVGEDPEVFPRSPDALEKVVNYRYPGLITEVREEHLSEQTADLIWGYTYPMVGGILVHGRRSGPAVLTASRSHPRNRLVLVQELFQRVLDVPELGPTPLRQIVDGMYNYRQEPDWFTAELPVVLEYLSEIAAIEYYLPHSRRMVLIQEIAAEYQVPLDHAGRYLSFGYIAYFEKYQDSAAVQSA